MNKNVAVLLAGGSGARFGSSLPKQFLMLGGKTVLEHSLSAFQNNDYIDEIVLVVHADYKDMAIGLLKKGSYDKVRKVLNGGKERTDSTLAALRAYESEEVCMLFHDAARPLVSSRLIDAVCLALRKKKVVTAAVPCTDTMAEVEGNAICKCLERSRLRSVQTPQGFHREILARAYSLAMKDKAFKATDDAGVVKRYLPDTEIDVVEGDPENMKLTYAADLPIFEHLLSIRKKNKSKEETAPFSGADYLQEYRKRYLRPLQMKMLEMLTSVTDILEKNKINYWLAGGTLLGAIRHKGFIPWDDDIDIDVEAKDLHRMIDVLRKELPKDLILPDPPESSPIYKVRCLNSFFVEFGDDFQEDYVKGVFIDIFPQLDCPNVTKTFAKKVAKGYCKANSILHKKHYYSCRSFAEFFYFGFKRLFYRVLWKSAYWLKGKGKAYAPALNNNGVGVLHFKENIFPLKKILFEGRLFYAPNNPDAILRGDYGDYMQLPPVEKRQVHAIYYDIDLK